MSVKGIIMQVRDYYPITTRVTPEGDTSSFVTDDDLKKYTKPMEYESLMRHLTGSARYLEGVYLNDIERWLNRRK